jgi:hypothetical protein
MGKSNMQSSSKKDMICKHENSTTLIFVRTILRLNLTWINSFQTVLHLNPYLIDPKCTDERC